MPVKVDYTYWDNLAKSGNTYQMGERKHRIHVLDVVRKYNLSNILDVGMGTAPIYELLNKYSAMWSYKGVDYSAGFVTIARNNFPKGEFEVQDARELKEQDNSYDLVLLMHTLDHIDDWKKAINEAVRVSRKYVQIILWRPFVNEGTNLNTKSIEDNKEFSDSYLQEYSYRILVEYFVEKELKLVHSHEIINDDKKWNYCFLLKK